MNTNQILNKVRTLLGMEVKLEQMKLADGMTILEADTFEAGSNVVIVTEDEQKIPLPVGEYELEDGRILVVVQEGIISEVKDVAEEQEMPEAPAQEMPTEATEEVKAEEVSNPKKTVESIVKETFFAEIEALKKENEELKAQLLSKEVQLAEKEEIKTELTEEVKPIVHNPENEKITEMFKYSQKRGMSTMDRILEKLNK